MKYMGSKARVKKQLIPIIESYINKDTTYYIEPFVGGANVIDSVNFNRKIGYDKHRELIALLNAIKNGYKPPEKISVEHYNEVKNSYKNKDKKFEDHYYGTIGFLGAFRGLFFDSQGCGDYISQGRTRNNYIESRKNILKQYEGFQNVTFICSDYKDINIPDNSVVYCDPPYQNTSQKGYADNNSFDYTYFWDWVREISKRCIILVSEYNAPEDFNCIWEKEVSTNLSVQKRKKDIEKLFIHKSIFNKIS